MEKLSLTYKPLFSIEVWHDFFLGFWENDDSKKILNLLPEGYNLRDFVTVRPSATTLQVLSNYGLKCLPDAKGIRILAQAELIAGNEYKTSFRLDSRISFAFELSIDNPGLLSFTNLPVDVMPSHVLAFNNLSGNKTVDGSYLSKPLLVYSGSSNYKIGDVVVTNANDDRLFESIADSSVNGDTNDRNKWLPFEYKNSANDNDLAKGIQVVTKEDMLPMKQHYFYYQRDNDAAGSEIKFVLKDVFDRTLDLGNSPGTNIPQDRIQAPADSSIPIKHQLFLSHLPNGQYELIIDGETQPKNFYLINTLEGKSPFGMIDIFGNTPDDDFKFFETRTINQRKETVIKEKVFKLRFKNRSTRWRYFEDGDTSGAPKLTLLHPLSKHYIKLLNDLPNPIPDTVTVAKNNATGEIEAFYSDIFLYDIKI